MSNFKKLWTHLSNIGVYDDTNELDADKIILLNQITFFMCFFELTLIVRGFFWWETSELIIYFVFGITLLIFVFNYFKKYLLAKLVLNLFFPLLVFACIIGFGDGLGGEYTFLVFLVNILIFHDNYKVRTALLLWNTIVFFLSVWYTQTHESPFAYRMDIFDRLSLYLASGVALICIIMIFIKQNKKYLKQKNEFLKSLDNKNLELEKANQNLGAANEELSKYAQITSHDLKTPTRSIISFTGLTKRAIKNNDDKGANEYLDYISTSANQMYYLINDILEISKIGNTQDLELDEVNLNDIIDDIKKQIGGFIEENNAVINYNDLPTLRINRTHIILLFKNLIENGIKYNKSDLKMIDISFVRKDDSVGFCFLDNGIGISDEYRELIFEMFKRLHTSNEYSGTGLGLSTCKKIVDHYNGKIWVDPEEREGTRFCVELPCEVIED